MLRFSTLMARSALAPPQLPVPVEEKYWLRPMDGQRGLFALVDQVPDVLIVAPFSVQDGAAPEQPNEAPDQ